jgi:hypothetical protein
MIYQRINGHSCRWSDNSMLYSFTDSVTRVMLSELLVNQIGENYV